MYLAPQSRLRLASAVSITAVLAGTVSIPADAATSPGAGANPSSPFDNGFPQAPEDSLASLVGRSTDPVLWRAIVPDAEVGSLAVAHFWRDRDHVDREASLVPIAAGRIGADGAVEVRAALAGDLAKVVRPGVGTRLLVTVGGRSQKSVGVSIVDVVWDGAVSSAADQRGVPGAWSTENAAPSGDDGDRSAPAVDRVPISDVAFASVDAPKPTAAKGFRGPGLPSGWSCSGAISAPNPLPTAQTEVTGYIDNVLTNVTETMTFRSSRTSTSVWGFKAGVGAGPLTVGGDISFERSEGNSAGATAIFDGWLGHYQKMASVNLTRHALWTVSQCVYSTSKFPPTGTTTQSLTIVGPYKMEWWTGYAGSDVPAFTQSAPFTRKIGASQSLFKSTSVVNRNSAGVSVNLAGAIPGGGTLSGGLSYSTSNVAGQEVTRSWTTHGLFLNGQYQEKWLGGWGGPPLDGATDVHMQLWDA